MPAWLGLFRALSRADSPGVRILQIDERCAAEPGYGVHWTSDLVVRSVLELAGGQGALAASGVDGADVALVEISDRPGPSVVPLMQHLRSQALPVAVRVHRASRPSASESTSFAGTPLGAVLQAAIEAADAAFFSGRGELVRVASELSVAPDKPSLIPSPIQLPAELGSTLEGGAIGIGFGEKSLPAGVRPVSSRDVLHREIMACSVAALGPELGPGYPALTRGLLDRGIAVVAARAQAALDGYPVSGWVPVSSGADAEEWSRALASLGAIESSRRPRKDQDLGRWFDCLRGLSKRELLTSGT